MTTGAPRSLSGKPAPSDRARLPLSRRQWVLAFGILAYGIGAAAFWILTMNAKVDTAATYVGIPTLLAFILATTPRSRSRTGSILKGMMIALVLVGITLGPGVVCLIISAPLFLGIGVFIGRILDAPMAVRDRRLRAGVIGVVLAIASLEGLHPILTADSQETVTVVRTLPISADQFRNRLAKTPVLNQPLPFPLNAGLPVAVRVAGSGLEVGTRRSLFLEDRNMYLTLLGKSGRKDGDVVFEVAQFSWAPYGGEKVRFKLVSDDSHVAKWLTWTESTVVWQPNRDGGHPLRVTWTISFERRLAPAWYFRPILRYAVARVTELMLDTVAAQDD